MTSSPLPPQESAASKLAFTFACWGLILTPLALPAIVLGHLGRQKDKLVSPKSKTAAVALVMGYLEIALLLVIVYFLEPLVFRPLVSR